MQRRDERSRRSGARCLSSPGPIARSHPICAGVCAWSLLDRRRPARRRLGARGLDEHQTDRSKAGRPAAGGSVSVRRGSRVVRALARGGWLIGSVRRLVCARHQLERPSQFPARRTRRAGSRWASTGAARSLGFEARSNAGGADAMSHGLESCAPGRAPEQRLRARRAARAWSRAAAGRPDSGVLRARQGCYGRALP